MAQMELAVLDFIQELFRNPFMDSLMPAITSLGDAGFLWILLGLALLCSRKYRRTGAAVLLSLAADLVICNLLLKNMVARVRPCDLNPAVQLLIARPSDFSFPSGHTAAAFTSVFFPLPGKQPAVEAGPGPGGGHCVLQNVPVRPFSHGHPGRRGRGLGMRPGGTGCIQASVPSGMTRK